RLPGDVAMIHLLDERGQIIDSRAYDRFGEPITPVDQRFIAQGVRSSDAVLWEGAKLPISSFASGMTSPLRHGETLMGMLTLFSRSTVYDDNNLRLFNGIATQAALALHNAELYQIQANYAVHLEDMVAERTKELQSAQQLLIRSEKLASIGHLAASIAHEINNPLMPIGLLLERLVDDLQDAGVKIDFQEIEMIQEHVERIRRIVSSLLDFARQDANLRPLDMNKLIENILKLNHKFFEHERIRVESNFATTPPVFGSKDQLEAVFMNLALNAQAAMTGGGKLTVRTYNDRNQVAIDFVDTGTGIAKEDLNRIFDPFFSTKPTGTGLGLFVCYSVVEGHHGTIEVESEVGKGTRFTVRLPTYEG
ncbi:MAG: GAF domain-containing protein, partial [Anaerolineae bacterium]|nr:GAF domain-containing protein [Anaerolineae bacterium]